MNEPVYIIKYGTVRREQQYSTIDDGVIVPADDGLAHVRNVAQKQHVQVGPRAYAPSHGLVPEEIRKWAKVSRFGMEENALTLHDLVRVLHDHSSRDIKRPVVGVNNNGVSCCQHGLQTQALDIGEWCERPKAEQLHLRPPPTTPKFKPGSVAEQSVNRDTAPLELLRHGRLGPRAAFAPA